MNHKNRGMLLESLINKTLKLYAENGVGLFHKKTLPITFSAIKSKENGKHEIEKAWVGAKSTTDYYGIYKGNFVTFEAKSTQEKSLPLSNIKDHQWRYIMQINEHGGIGFFIIAYASFDEYYLMTLNQIEDMGTKSISIEYARDNFYRIELVYPGILDFAPILETLR